MQPPSAFNQDGIFLAGCSTTSFVLTKRVRFAIETGSWTNSMIKKALKIKRLV